MIDRDTRKTTLPNGFTILTDRVPHLHSVSMGVWVTSGSRNEPADLNGISHFIEHMVFRGTHRRSAEQIAFERASLGDKFEAFTEEEMVYFHIEVPSEQLAPALDLLADLVLHPTFPLEGIQREQHVILEEILDVEGNPDDLIWELFARKFWKGTALARPITGTRKSLRLLNQKTLINFYVSHFTPSNMILSAAGNLDHDDFIAKVEEQFGSLSAVSDKPVQHECPAVTPHSTSHRRKAFDQAHLFLGVAAPPADNPDRHALRILNTVLGDGSNSRLFQTIREAHGLTYDIKSEVTPYRDTGLVSISTRIAVHKTKKTLELILREFRRLKEETVSKSELKCAKEQVKSSLILELESSSDCMERLANEEMYFGRCFGIDEITCGIDAVTPETVQALARRLFRQEALALTLLGNVGTIKIKREDLAC